MVEARLTYIGILAGDNLGTVVASYAKGGSTNGGGGASDYIGGLVGYNNTRNSVILASYATAAANGDGGNDQGIGGLVGVNNDGNIIDSYATGAVNGGAGNDNVGGLIGWDQNTEQYYYSLLCHWKCGWGHWQLTDRVGKLTARNSGTITASYGFGSTRNGTARLAGIGTAIPTGLYYNAGR